MLNVEYNDHLTELTILNDLNEECFIVVDNGLKVYGKLTYGTFAPTTQELLNLWTKSLKEYLQLDNDETTLTEWKQNTLSKSIEHFKESDIYKETESDIYKETESDIYKETESEEK